MYPYPFRSFTATKSEHLGARLGNAKRGLVIRSQRDGAAIVALVTRLPKRDCRALRPVRWKSGRRKPRRMNLPQVDWRTRRFGEQSVFHGIRTDTSRRRWLRLSGQRRTSYSVARGSMGMWLSDLAPLTFSLVFVPNIYEAALPEDERICLLFYVSTESSGLQRRQLPPSQGF